MPDTVQGAFTIQRLLEAMGRLGASDLHIKVGVPPNYRINGLLKAVQGPPLTAEEADHIVDPIFPEKLMARYENEGAVDFATFVGEDRFRCNIYRSGGHTNVAIRRVKSEIPTYEALRLPPIYNEIVEKTNEGMVLVCGVTGSGKSTTLAAMIEHLNKKEADNIITIEDPVEYRFSRARSIVSQREIGIDVPSYPVALRYVVRQDPDVIFIGEMRDHDTVLAAIQAAETGHLVFGSLHTADTMQSFNRILEFFPREEHGFIRSALATSMRAVCAQRLLPALPETGFGMVPATEVLLNTPIVREKIRDGYDEDIPAIINGSTSEGMRSFTYSLAELCRKEWVSVQTAMAYAPNRDALDSALKGVEVKAQSLVHRVKSSRH
ncbi:MAG: PilT/PilU family type 4a pilus ATPase [Phycisphaerae bacterium]|nr:PilT/PilU family type 4a pilus ATPase [Phycisphaerae bacterium]